MVNSTQIAAFLSFLIMLYVQFLHHTGASATTSGANDTDRLSLLAIKDKISLDPQGVMSSWNDSVHFCQWESVTCGKRHRRVVVLNLTSRGLVGSLSPYVGNLSFLRELRLNNNTLGGRIPPQVGGLFRLDKLWLSNNSLEGEIPTNISRCNKLTSLSLSVNKLVGKIPIEFSSLSMLNFLGVNFNNLSGGIPPFIGNFSSLETFSLAFCHLGGSIPKDIFNGLHRLRFIGLVGNELTGSIPSSVYNLSLLETFSVPENHLRGSLPTSIGLMLPRLHVLQLGDNQLTGTLPLSISNCSELESLDVGGNDFYGKVAIDFANLQNLGVVRLGGNNLGTGEHDELKFIDSLSNCSNIESLDLQSNNFRGILPNSLGNLSANNLYTLSLDSNYLYGSLPSSIGNLFSLTKLGFGGNQFIGTIPITIGNLPNLQVFYSDNSNFSGKIPDSIGNLSMLLELDLSFNKFEGDIPSSLGKCHYLYSLFLNGNNLSGSIPRQIFGLSSLSIVLDLGSNQLSGPLQVEIGSLKNLNQLILDDNYLSGELPSALGDCINLELLYLPGNLFQGSLPTSLSSLRALQHLNLSHNNFSGPIPRFLEEIHLKELDISFNDFEGVVPMKGVFANSSAISVVGNHRLCGGISKLQLHECISKHSKGRRKLSRALIVVISLASTLVAVVMVLLFLFCLWHRKKIKDQPSGLVSKEPFLKVSYEKLLKATDGFSSANLIGVGGFASVYKGILGEDGMIVAVKVLNLQQLGGFKSFMNECEALRHVRHRNLIKIVTCCSSVDFQGNDFKALVYEFMPNGSLDWWLHSSPDKLNESESPRLSLLQRLGIAIDVACALDYLHHQCENPIIHCDLKPSNILLDGDMTAHVGDFGLAKFLLSEIANANPSSTSGIRGTIGYTPPEYGLGNEVSTQGDVYSYGILLLEMVIGKKPTDPLFQNGLNLHNYATMSLANRKLEIEESKLLNDKNEECLISILKVGVACSMESPQDRMDISLVIHDLRLARETVHSN